MAAPSGQNAVLRKPPARFVQNNNDAKPVILTAGKNLVSYRFFASLRMTWLQIVVILNEVKDLYDSKMNSALYDVIPDCLLRGSK